MKSCMCHDISGDALDQWIPPMLPVLAHKQGAQVLRRTIIHPLKVATLLLPPGCGLVGWSRLIP
jgi:hypothetical protein